MVQSTEQQREQQRLALVQQQLALVPQQLVFAQQEAREWCMGSQEYINLNPYITPGTVIIQNNMAQESPWQATNVIQIDHLIDHLRSSMKY